MILMTKSSDKNHLAKKLKTEFTQLRTYKADLVKELSDTKRNLETI